MSEERNVVEIPPDIHVVALRHNLGDWNIPEHIDKIESIETVWFFDKAVQELQRVPGDGSPATAGQPPPGTPGLCG